MPFGVRSRRLRTVCALLAAALPWAVRRPILVHVLGHSIHPTARVGFSLVDVGHLELGPGAEIGHLNVVRGLDRVTLGRSAVLAHLNWVNAVRRDRGFLQGVDRSPELVLGPCARIMVLHLLDCTARIELRERATVAGYQSLLMTHSFDPASHSQTAQPIVVGERTVLAARVTVLPGAEVAGHSLVAAGAVVVRPLPGSHHLYGGVPARVLGTLAPDTGFLVAEEEIAR